MTRPFTVRRDSALKDAHEGDLPKMPMNFANKLAKLASSLAEMILAPTVTLADTVTSASGK